MWVSIAIIVVVLFAALAIWNIFLHKKINEEIGKVTTHFHKRVKVLENHSEIVKQTTCFNCKRQVARYYPTAQGTIICANCDVEGFESYHQLN